MKACALRFILQCAAASLATTITVPSLAAAGAVFPGASAPVVAIEQRIGAALPLNLPFVDADGRAVRLGDYFDHASGGSGVAVVLVLGYYRCAHLCQTVAQGAIEALADSGVPPKHYRVLAVSIDPDETATDAGAARARDVAWARLAYAAGTATAGGDGLERPRIDALVGPAASTSALAAAVGFGFQRIDAGDGANADTASFAHAAGFVVVTPEGRVSRYFLGVRHDPRGLRAALEAAGDDAVGSLVDRLVLLCAHFDPSIGRHSTVVLVALRVVGIALMLALAAWIWRYRRMPASGSR